MGKRFGTPSLAAAVAAGAFVLTAYAADRLATDRPSAEAGAGHAWEGRISYVDAPAHQLMLSDAHMAASAGGADRGPSGADHGTTGADRGTAGANNGPGADRGAAGSEADRGTASAGDKAGNKDHAVTIRVAENAKIMIDDKAGELSDLKPGMMARVYVHGGSSGAGAHSGTGANSSGSGTADRPNGSDNPGAPSKDVRDYFKTSVAPYE